MTFKPSPEAWMSFLYGEMEGKEAEQMKEYLKENPEAQAEWEALQRTREMMQEVPTPQTPPIPNIIIQEKTPVKWFQNRWLHAAAAGIALMISAKLIGVQVSFKEKTFSIQFGAPAPTGNEKELEEKIAMLEQQNDILMASNQNDSLFQAVFQLGSSLEKLEARQEQLARRNTNPAMSEAQLAQLKTDIGDANYQMVVNMLSETQQYQQAYTEQLLTDFSQFLEQQRQQDLKLMEVAFNHIIEQNDIQQEETKYLLTELRAQLGD
ncbi:MAG: hypothetical protein AAFR87_15060 [Bacteroidota bacterium]